LPNDEVIWQLADEALRDGVPACLIVMVAASGSVPNRPGAKLLVTGEGRHEGTVGGGVTEQTLVSRAADMLSSGARGCSEVVEVEHTEGGSGALCSGTQTFALLRLDTDDAEVVSRIARALLREQERCIVLDTNGIDLVRERPSGDGPRWHEAGGGWQYLEPVGPRDTVTIIGGGHVSLALSRVLTPLGFRVVVLDDRPDLDTMERNEWAAERRVVDYATIRDAVPEGNRSYVCVMTFAHERDEDVLRALVGRPFRYLGMMGSPAKVASVFSHLSDSGIDSTALSKVRAPIGVPIESNTPEEIAVSVAAELVAVRNGAELFWREPAGEAS